jgi:lipoate-protein ligase A
MRRLHLTLPTPEENLALDEALLEWAEEGDSNMEFLRLWESRQPAVVVGRSSRVDQEVNRAACREESIPILRRSSGGAAIVAGPGCLMYAVILSYALRPELKDIRRAHRFVLGRLGEALQTSLRGAASVVHAGTSDLVLVKAEHSETARKFSGNSLRAKRSHLLYHGTLLYDFELRLIEDYLQLPPRQPEYRDRRTHADFVINLPLTRSALIEAVERAWPSESQALDWPAARVAKLVAQRFSRESWNFEFR